MRAQAATATSRWTSVVAGSAARTNALTRRRIELERAVKQLAELDPSQSA